MKTRLKDVAAATGYSVNTISHALRDLPDIAEETKEYIRRVADELNYIPNFQASSLKSGKNHVVSVILPDIINPHFSIVFREIEQFFKQVDITPFFINTNERADNELNAIRISIAQNVGGIILCPTQENTDGLKMLESSKIPFVLIGRHFAPEFDTHYAVCDDVKGAYLATQHLIREGHRKIAFVRVNSRISSDRERYLGYCKALEEAGIAVCEENILNLTLIGGDNTDIIYNFLKHNKECTAILSFNDILAYTIIREAYKQGLRVPEDISVIGFDNICSEYNFPLMLSSVSVSKKKMARMASELLYDAMNAKQEGNELPHEHIVLPTKLYLRETTKAWG